MKPLTLDKTRIMLSMPTFQSVPGQTVVSLISTGNALVNQRVPYCFEMQIGNSLVHLARTRAAHNFLKSECTHMFWVDSDITWKPDDFMRMTALATHPDMDVVCASYPYKQEPVLFHLNVEDESKPIESNQYGCIPVNSAGLGFCVVKRKVIEALAEKAPKIKFRDMPDVVRQIFRTDIIAGPDGDPDIFEPRGEDIAFFDDIRALGFRVWLDPNVELGHMGVKEYKGALAKHLGVVKVEEKAA